MSKTRSRKLTGTSLKPFCVFDRPFPPPVATGPTHLAYVSPDLRAMPASEVSGLFYVPFRRGVGVRKTQQREYISYILPKGDENWCDDITLSVAFVAVHMPWTDSPGHVFGGQVDNSFFLTSNLKKKHVQPQNTLPVVSASTSTRKQKVRLQFRACVYGTQIHESHNIVREQAIPHPKFPRQIAPRIPQLHNPGNTKSPKSFPRKSLQKYYEMHNKPQNT